MRTDRALVVALVCGLLALGYSGPCTAGDATIVIEDTITYGKAGGTELKLDLARPQGDGPFPAIVFIHGGGWAEGNRQGYRGQIQEAARRGYVAVTISYRLMKFDQIEERGHDRHTDLPGTDPRCQGGDPVDKSQCQDIPHQPRPDWGHWRFCRWSSLAVGGPDRFNGGLGRR